jgi:hypothetical protein
MTDQIKWSWGMSDDDFEKAVRPYIIKSFNSLHTLCCIMAKVDPEQYGGTVGEGYEDWSEEGVLNPPDRTRRYFDFARRSLNGQDPDFPLKAEKRPEVIANGKEIILETIVFFRWAISKWPSQSSDLKLVEKRRKERNVNTGAHTRSKLTKADKKKADQYQEFLKMMQKLPNDPTTYLIDPLARMLIKQMKGKPYNQSLTQLTGRINFWYPEYLKQLPKTGKMKLKPKAKKTII